MFQYDETHTDTQKLAEIAYIHHLITELYPTGIISIVADSFDFWYMMEYGIKVLKPAIESRKPNALGMCKVVFRPDSGNPVDVICGKSPIGLMFTGENRDKTIWRPERGSCEAKGAIQCLYEVFGSTTNAKGFEVLNPKVGLIYGDSITLPRQEEILNKLATKNYATDCIVLGVGSYSLAFNSRDTLGFAMKATHTIVNGQSIDIYKDPKTSDGTKKSAKGLLKVIYDGSFETYSKTLPKDGTPKDIILVDQCTPKQESEGLLRTVFSNGQLVIDESLQTIRARLWNSKD
jgi:nicotinamide phosphoribosyltransferase